jgi:hypothetical protein
MSSLRFATYALCTETGVYLYASERMTADPGQQAGDIVECPAGTRATGGGVGFPLGTDAFGGSEVATSVPFGGSPPDGGWSGYVNNETASAATARVYVVCRV